MPPAAHGVRAGGCSRGRLGGGPTEPSPGEAICPTTVGQAEGAAGTGAPRRAPTADSVQTAPKTTSAPEAGGGSTPGSSLATPAGSPGATTTTTAGGPVQPAPGSEETAPKGPELSSTSSAPAQVGPASASTGSATS